MVRTGWHGSMLRTVVGLLITVMAILARPVAGEDGARCLDAPGWTRISFAEAPSQRPPPDNWQGARAFAQSWRRAETFYGGGVHGLYRSDDCGRSWTTLPDFGRPIPGDPPFYFYEPVAVSPSGRVFATRADWRLSWTDDDGQTWASTPSRMSAFPWPLYFVRSGIGWGVFYQPTGGGGGAQTLAYSTDDGVTWNHGPRGGMPRIMGVDTRDGQAVLGETRAGEVGRSTDFFVTSVTWATFPARVRAVIGNDDGTRFWVATDDGLLHRSRDGGQTWETAGLTPGVIKQNGLSVSHHDPEGLFAINELGELWYLRDVAVAAPAQIP